MTVVNIVRSLIQNTSKGLHKVFKAVVNYILHDLPILGESVLEVSFFITEPRNVAEVTRLSEDINKPWINSTLKVIKKFYQQPYF